jgi:hypothetical protein
MCGIAGFVGKEDYFFPEQLLKVSKTLRSVPCIAGLSTFTVQFNS